MDIKYEHLRVDKDDRVRITVTDRNTGLPFTAEGPVLSAYSVYVYEPGTPHNANFMASAQIGYQPTNIEMTNQRTNKYVYWKAVDGGIVEKLIGDEYVQVYPITFEGKMF